ncbi:6454_t:CDS:1, partial [Dentiscutata heterogama]
MTTSLIAEIMLFCLVLGDAVENAFVIDIKEDWKDYFASKK